MENKTGRAKLHRKQTFLQIILPVILSVLFVAGLVALLVYLSGSDPYLPQKMADLVIMTIITLLFVLGIVAIYLLFKSIAAVNEGIRKLPQGLDKANDKIASIDPVITEVLNKSLEPLITLRAWLAGIGHIFTRKS